MQSETFLKQDSSNHLKTIKQAVTLSDMIIHTDNSKLGRNHYLRLGNK